MPVILIAFIVLATLTVFIPGAREDLAADRALDGRAAAGQLRTWHAAAVRACWAAGGPCAAGSGSGAVRIQDAFVAAQMPPSAAAGTAYATGRFGSYFDGTYVFSLFTGFPAARPVEAAADAGAALAAISSPDSYGSIGIWNAATGQFVGNAYSLVLNGQPRVRQPTVVATQPLLFVPNALNGAPMIATQVR